MEQTGRKTPLLSPSESLLILFYLFEDDMLPLNLLAHLPALKFMRPPVVSKAGSGSEKTPFASQFWHLLLFDFRQIIYCLVLNFLIL